MAKRIQVPNLSIPERLDKFLIGQFPNSSRQYWRDHLETIVRIDGNRAAKGRTLRGGESIELLEDPPAEETPSANPDIPLKILYQDEWLFAVDKPAGLPCHPLRRKESETLVNAVLAAFPKQAALPPAREAGLVHRLDNETSGVVLFARSPEALAGLRSLSQSGGIRKTYLALVAGMLTGKGRIKVPIGHHPGNVKKMVAIEDPADQERIKARRAETCYESVETFESASLLKVEIRVGARHQIRVHLAHLGHPLLGDKLYGKSAQPETPHHFLHASELHFQHPYLGKNLSISAPLPEEFSSLLRLHRAR